MHMYSQHVEILEYNSYVSGKILCVHDNKKKCYIICL
jgi:hypothetical protein